MKTRSQKKMEIGDTSNMEKDEEKRKEKIAKMRVELERQFARKLATIPESDRKTWADLEKYMDKERGKMVKYIPKKGKVHGFSSREWLDSNCLNEGPVVKAAKFAVEGHNQNHPNDKLQFVSVVEALLTVLIGCSYEFTVEVQKPEHPETSHHRKGWAHVHSGRASKKLELGSIADASPDK